MVEEGDERGEQLAAGLLERLIDVVREGPPRVAIAGQRTLGQQVDRGDRTRRLRPRGGASDAGERRSRREPRVYQLLDHGANNDGCVPEETLEAPDHGHRALSLDEGRAAKDHDEAFALRGDEGVESSAGGGLAKLFDRRLRPCLLYTSDAADDLTRVDLGG